MATLKENAAYLKGLAEGMGIDEAKNELENKKQELNLGDYSCID